MQDKVTKLQGLVTQYNPANIGPGALVQANDCSIRRENVIEDRRGYKAYGTLLTQPAQLMVYDNKVIAHHGSTLSYDNGSGVFGTYAGTYAGPTSRKMRAVEASSNLFVTTSAGIKVFSDLSGTAGRLAGAPRALNATYSTTGSTGFLANNYQCAYRSLIKRTDARSNVIKGYPSQRLWAINSAGGARNLSVTVYIPSEAIAGDVVEVYRTEQVSGVSSDTAGDEMGLVYQYELTSTDLSNGYITFTDSVTDALRGATLYTSPSEEGISQANDRPPLSKDIALYKTFMLFANTKTKQRIFSTLVGTTKLGFQTTANLNSNTTCDNIASLTTNIKAGWKVEGAGIPANTSVASITSTVAIVLSQAATVTSTSQSVYFYTNQTITLASKTYAFGSSEITSGAGSPQVKVSTTGVAAADIDITARSFEFVVNRFSSNTSIYAYYISGADDTPGKLMFEERGLGASAFTIQASDTEIQQMFFPYPPVGTTTSACTSTQDERVNAVYVAKSQQNEHVPALNYLLIGPANKEILRVVALRDSAIVIKEEGVYRITGDTFANMVVTPIDLTVYCNAPDSVAVLANQVFMLSNQGVVLISESGVQVISRDIEPTILPLLNSSSLSDATFGVGYESERSYYLSTLSVSTDTYATNTFVYNIFTRVWVRHTYAFISGVVEPSVDKLHFSKRSDLKVYQERKSFDDTDYADPETAIVITSLSSPSTVEFTISGATPDVGWVILQGSTGFAIESLTTIPGGYRAVLDGEYPSGWATGAATIYPSVGFDIQFHGWQGPVGLNTLKQVRGVGVYTDDIPGNNTVTSLVATFKTNFDDDEEEVTITQPGVGWGGAWGSSPWGGTGDSKGYPTWVPRNKNYCTRFYFGVKHKAARERLVITGVGYLFEAASDRISR